MSSDLAIFLDRLPHYYLLSNFGGIPVSLNFVKFYQLQLPLHESMFGYHAESSTTCIMIVVSNLLHGVQILRNSSNKLWIKTIRNRKNSRTNRSLRRNSCESFTQNWSFRGDAMPTANSAVPGLKSRALYPKSWISQKKLSREA